MGSVVSALDLSWLGATPKEVERWNEFRDFGGPGGTKTHLAAYGVTLSSLAGGESCSKTRVWPDERERVGVMGKVALMRKRAEDGGVSFLIYLLSACRDVRHRRLELPFAWDDGGRRRANGRMSSALGCSLVLEPMGVETGLCRAAEPEEPAANDDGLVR